MKRCVGLRLASVRIAKGLSSGRLLCLWRSLERRVRAIRRPAKRTEGLGGHRPRLRSFQAARGRAFALQSRSRCSRRERRTHKVAHALCGAKFEKRLADGNHNNHREGRGKRPCRYLNRLHCFEIVHERRQNGVDCDAEYRRARRGDEGREKNRAISCGNNIAARERQRCAITLPAVLIII